MNLFNFRLSLPIIRSKRYVDLTWNIKANWRALKTPLGTGKHDLMDNDMHWDKYVKINSTFMFFWKMSLQFLHLILADKLASFFELHLWAYIAANNRSLSNETSWLLIWKVHRNMRFRCFFRNDFLIWPDAKVHFLTKYLAGNI